VYLRVGISLFALSFLFVEVDSNKYTMLSIWKAWGVVPQVIYACGVGVYAALCMNEVFDILFTLERGCIFLYFFIYLFDQPRCQ
jgi:hypothetical protein